MDNERLEFATKRLDHILVNIDWRLLHSFHPEAKGLEIPDILPKDPEFTPEFYKDKGMSDEEAENEIFRIEARQIKELIRFMRRGIEYRHLSDEERPNHDPDHKVMGFDEFCNLVKSTYTMKDMIEIGSNLCGDKNSGLSRKYIERTRKINRRTNIANALASNLAQVIFDGKLFYRDITQYVNPSMRGMKEDREREFIENNMQVPLIHCLLGSYGRSMEVARTLTPQLIEAQEFMIEPDNFFVLEQKPRTRKANIFSILKFALLACHIGHFSRPQYNKWEQVYSRSCGRTLEEIRDMGVEFVHYAPGEAIAEFERQGRAEAILFKRLMYMYDRTLDDRNRIDDSYSHSRGRVQMLSCDNKRYEKEVARIQGELDRIKKEGLDLEGYKSQARVEAQREFTGRIRELEERLEKGVTNERSIIRRAERAEEQVSDLLRRTDEYEVKVQGLNSKLSGQGKGSIDPSVYHVEVHESASHYCTENLYSNLMKEAAHKLSTGGRKCRPFRKGEGHNIGHDNLKGRYPEYDDFVNVKVRGNEYRGIAAAKGKEMHVLLMLTHEEYVRLCTLRDKNTNGNGSK